MQYLTLNDGNKIPQLGFGVFQISDFSQAERAVGDAIQVGYRLFDTAAAYGNEAAVGKAIRQSGIDRSQFFVTSKLWIDHFGYEKAKQGIDDSLNNLGLDYIDLYLLHQPLGDVAGAWQALEEAQKAGKIKSIGVSNFRPKQLRKLESTSDVQPSINQIEISPWYQRTTDVCFLKKENVVPEAWAPFAEGKGGIFSNETITQIGQKYEKTNGQVILRWLIQRGIVVIPKSVHKDRMAENFDVFDFELSDVDMRQMARLDKHRSQFFFVNAFLRLTSLFG